SLCCDYPLQQLALFPNQGNCYLRILHSFPTRRSSDLIDGNGSAGTVAARDAGTGAGRRAGPEPAAAGDPAAGLSRAAAAYRQRADRKSTRLNSSHVKISYAVFCLKKKTNWTERVLLSM